ncbi:hypothetical protein CEXT_538101 [Caerostris extrusa]|uniref:Uncharacterized protein n=1 Tax=Caerostris extrusa TaxID=172846 RepID=A0AAV4XM88_CAEEX|nr:hypothetical protein CEXT_538101 [Caerostris extrusa]
MAKSIRQLDNCDWSSTPSTCQTMGQLLVRCDRPSLDGIMSSPWNYAAHAHIGKDMQQSKSVIILMSIRTSRQSNPDL